MKSESPIDDLVTELALLSAAVRYLKISPKAVCLSCRYVPSRASICAYVQVVTGVATAMAVPKQWFTVDEAAEYLGVSKRTVYKLTQEGRLPAYVIGMERIRRFRRQDLDNAPRRLELIAYRQKGNEDDG